MEHTPPSEIPKGYDFESIYKDEEVFSGSDYADWEGPETKDTIPFFLFQLENLLKQEKFLEELNIFNKGKTGVQKILEGDFDLENKKDLPIFFRSKEEPNQKVNEGESLDIDDPKLLLNVNNKIIGFVGEREISVVKKEGGYIFYFDEFGFGEYKRNNAENKAFNMFSAEIEFSFDSNQNLKIEKAIEYVWVIEEGKYIQKEFTLKEEDLKKVLARIIETIQ